MGYEIMDQLAAMGDKNTKFFHATTIQRRQRNQISMLQDEHEGWIRDPTQLKNMSVSFFQNLYNSVEYRDYGPILTQCPQVVIAEMNTMLIAEVSREEIKQTTFQLGATKAPRTDSLNGLFYQTHWDILQDDIFILVQDFFRSSLMPPEFNRTLISLIPKVPHPERLDQYQPISLCNFIYKKISKVLANRLKPWLPKLISTE